MRLYEYVPVQDHLIDDESLIQRVFGPEFCVVDDQGQLLTTAHNRNLLRRARMLLEHADAQDRALLDEGLRDLEARAEIVSQRDYEAALLRDEREQGGAGSGLDLGDDATSLLEGGASFLI